MVKKFKNPVNRESGIVNDGQSSLGCNSSTFSPFTGAALALAQDPGRHHPRGDIARYGAGRARNHGGCHERRGIPVHRKNNLGESDNRIHFHHTASAGRERSTIGRDGWECGVERTFY